MPLTPSPLKDEASRRSASSLPSSVPHLPWWCSRKVQPAPYPLWGYPHHKHSARTRTGISWILLSLTPAELHGWKRSMRRKYRSAEDPGPGSNGSPSRLPWNASHGKIPCCHPSGVSPGQQHDPPQEALSGVLFLPRWRGQWPWRSLSSSSQFSSQIPGFPPRGQKGLRRHAWNLRLICSPMRRDTAWWTEDALSTGWPHRRFSYPVRIRSQSVERRFGCNRPGNCRSTRHEPAFPHPPPYESHGCRCALFQLPSQAPHNRRGRSADITGRSGSSVGYPGRSSSYGQTCRTGWSGSLKQGPREVRTPRPAYLI